MPKTTGGTNNSTGLGDQTGRFSKNPLLDRDRLGKVTREVNVQALEDSQPVGNELQGNDVEDTLKAVDGLGDLNLLGLRGLELLISRVADDNGLAAASND